jgi:hypothetical protein
MDERRDRDGAGLDRGVHAQDSAHHLFAHFVWFEAFCGFASAVAAFAEEWSLALNDHDAVVGNCAFAANGFSQIAHHGARERVSLIWPAKVDADDAAVAADRIRK